MLQRLEIPAGASGVEDGGRADIRTLAAELWAGLRTVFHGPPGLQPESSAGWSVLLVNSVLVLLLLSVLSADFAGEKTVRDLREQAASTASLQSALLRTELERYRSLPYVLSHEEEVAAALRSKLPQAAAALSRKLDTLAAETEVSVLWVMNTDGTGIASSTTPTGKTYCRRASWTDEGGHPRGCRDRYYFTEAMRSGEAEFFALGRADARPGMYLSKAIDAPEGRLGVAIAKVEFDKLEASWRHAGAPTFVTDRDGVVLISNVPEWRFRTLGALRSDVKARLTQTAQFGQSPLAPLPLARSETGQRLWITKIGAGPRQSYVMASQRVPNSTWTLHVLQPAGRAVGWAKLSTAFVFLVSGLLAITLIGIVVRRRARWKFEVARQASARAELESRVSARTAELTIANHRLRSEMDERRRIARNLSRLQDELVQANKLATLGQIAAGVAHEINQPVAAIRSYAENALVLLERRQDDIAARNLGLIGDLTQRISIITDELRAFSRRAGGGRAPVEVSSAIDGALLLASHRVAVEGVNVTRKGERAGLMVLAERVRLEQVLVNLLQNALDSLGAVADRAIAIELEERRSKVMVHISDTGAGMTPQTFETLFMPFQTTKPDGLGLGLVISRDIVTEFGGQLTAKRLERGARFTVSLRKAA